MDSFIEEVQQLPIIDSMSECPSRDEVLEAVKSLNTGKSPGADGLESEILQAGGEKMIDLLHQLICYDSECEGIPQEWIDATLVSLYKSGPVTNVEISVEFRCCRMLDKYSLGSFSTGL